MSNTRDIDICNDALALVAHRAITNFDGNSPASEAAARLYPLVLGQLLDAYPWRFAMNQRQLSRLNKTPSSKFDYAFKLPTDRDGTPHRFYSDADGSVIHDSAIYEDEVHCDYETVYCDYVKRGGLTGSFRHLLARALAADFAITLSDDRGLHDRFHQMAYGTPREGGKGGLFKTAASNDAKGAEARRVFRISGGPLLDAHSGRNGRRDWLAGQ